MEGLERALLLQLVRDRISRGLLVSVDALPRIEQMNYCRASGVAQPRCLTTKQCQNQSGLAACNTLGKHNKNSALKHNANTLEYTEPTTQNFPAHI